MKTYKIGAVESICQMWGEDRFKKMKELGFSYVDFDMCNTETAYYVGSQQECDAALLKHKAHIEEAGIEISQVHGPFRWPIYDGTVEERAERMDKMKRSIRMTSMLNCKNWVIHPIMPHGWQERRTDPGHEEDTWNINLEFMDELLKTAKDYDVTICYENMPMVDFSIGSVQEVLKFVKEMNDDHFKICLDTGHASMYPGQGLGDAVRLLGDEIRALHIHDNSGRFDNHWMPYFGIIDWEDFGKALKEINFQGVFSLETHPPKTLPMNAYEKMCRALVETSEHILNK